MKTYLDCLPCFLKQTLDACRMVTPDDRVHKRALKRVLQRAQEWSYDRSPPEMGREIHRIIREETGHPDPYRKVKDEYNQFALSLLPALRKRIEDSPDPFAFSVRLAIAGNIIDFALSGELGENRVRETIEETLTHAPFIDHLEELREAIRNASSILYLGDNAGEIALDRLLLEQLPEGKTTFVVRGAPVINDATREDARVVGLEDFAEVIDNGTDVPGTLVQECSPAFQARFSKADLVISKGQGNYETLSSVDREIVHLFKIKCPVIARDVGCAVGDFVILRRVGESQTRV